MVSWTLEVRRRHELTDPGRSDYGVGTVVTRGGKAGGLWLAARVPSTDLGNTVR